MFCFSLCWGPQEGSVWQNRPPQLGLARKESVQEGFQLGRGVVRVGIFREQWSLKHCTDWGSFETFPCPQKGDPPLKHLQALGSPPGTKSKTFSSSCCLCTCLPPVALTWQCLKLLPLISPARSASAVPALSDAGEDGPRGPGSTGGTEQPWQQPKRGNVSVQPLPSAWGGPGAPGSIPGPPPRPRVGSGCSHPALPREIRSEPCGRK